MKNTAVILFLMQLVAHLSIIPMIIYANWYDWIISVIVYFFTGCIGMTMTYHRLLSHQSWSTTKLIEYMSVIVATVGLTGPAISWVAIHRKHHAFVDTEKDPHSPTFKGMLWSHFLSMFADVDIRYARQLLKNKFYKFQHNYYFLINVIYAIVLYSIDPFLVVSAWLFPAMILWNAGSLILSFVHRDGYAHTDIPLAILVWGEGYHEYHHTHPSTIRFGKYDIGGIIIEYITKYNKTKTMG